MNRRPIETDRIYHIYNRGTDKRAIFMDVADRVRFLRSMRGYNDARPTPDWRTSPPEVQPLEAQWKLVAILAYCLMPNHLHLMLRQVCDGGISLYMKKLGTGYTMYFNQKYERSGALFQGKFKSVLVNRDEYLRHLPHYIHLNPRELGGNWRTYPWSSYRAYVDGVDRLAALDNLDFMRTLYKPQSYVAHLDEWISGQRERANLGDILFD